jgi:hypothetical protein
VLPTYSAMPRSGLGLNRLLRPASGNKFSPFGRRASVPEAVAIGSWRTMKDCSYSSWRIWLVSPSFAAFGRSILLPGVDRASS